MASNARDVAAMRHTFSMYDESDDDDRVPLKKRAGDDTTAVPLEEIEPGALFHWLNRRNPRQARRRFATVYWSGWKRFLLAFFLCMFGLTFIVIGTSCVGLCTDWDRGLAFFAIGMVMFMPGMYGMMTLLFYVKGTRGYSYKQLPDFD
jgi:hypothetical protein